MPETKLDKTQPDPLRATLSQFSAKEDAEGVRARHPALFEPVESAPRREKGRVVPMGVLNLGMPRTGTMSMQHALQILGYRCYHSSVFFSRTSDCKLWDAALDAKFFGKGTPFDRDDWDHLLGEYSAVSADPPAVAFAEDLVAIYPEAKVILVERDVDAWLCSFTETVLSGMWSPLMHRISDWDPWFLGPMRDTHMRWAHGWFKASSKDEMIGVSRRMYQEHYARVRQITPQDRLLEYSLGDGWEPLCDFLGCEVPDCEFPHVNDNDAVWEQMAITARRGMRNAVWRVAQIGSMVLVALVVAWLWWM